MKIVYALLLAVTSCTPAAAPAAPRGAPPSETEIALVLDDWHDAAARADEERYFGHIAPSGVFLGTDAKERWVKPAFRAYAHPHFASGKAWSFRAVERHVAFSASGDVAWFDERLDTARLGPARGSGVLIRERVGAPWMIAHYNLSIPIPNERFEEVKAVIGK